MEKWQKQTGLRLYLLSNMTSYLEYNNKGFWVNDSLMQFSLGFLYCEIKKESVLVVNKYLSTIILENALGYYPCYYECNLIFRPAGKR